MKNKILWPVLFLCTLPVQAQQDMTEAEGSVTLQECLSRGLESNFSIRMVKTNKRRLQTMPPGPMRECCPPWTSVLPTAAIWVRPVLPPAPLESPLPNVERMTDCRCRHRPELDYFRRLQRVDQLQATATPERTGRTANPHYDRRLCGIAHSRILQLHTGKNPFKNFRYAMSLSRERMRIVEVRYHIGNFSRLDYLQAKVDFNADSAQYMKQREVLNSSRIKLNELMANHDVTALIGIRDTAIDVNPDLQYDELWQATLATNASLLMADKNTEVVRADYKKNHVPRLSLRTSECRLRIHFKPL